MTTTYYLEDGNVTWEQSGSDTIHYVYDSDGDLVYMVLNGALYYYERNAQNDIIGLVDSNMNEVVTYTYDSWGKLLNIGGSLASTVGQKNPYRYRGYRYDNETGLYYLQSRYYDPNTGRFINADDTDQLDANKDHVLQQNLFAYCLNNPVNHTDPNGNWILDAIFLAVDVATLITHPSLENTAWVLLDVVCFADPTDLASAGSHVLKAAHAAEEVAHAADEASHVAHAAEVAKDLHRPYIRKSVRAAVEQSARKTADGKHFIDPNTLKPIVGKYDLGHKTGSEYKRLKAVAKMKGMTQKEFNDWLNHPKWYQIEDLRSNRSHRYEKR